MKTKYKIYCSVIVIIISLFLFNNYKNPKLPNDTTIDSLVVYKSKRKLQVYSGGKLLKTYNISLGKNPIGRKEFEGDNKTPEGIYFINGKNPHSVAYKNLSISYPNKSDIKYAEKIGKSTGGDIKIHGYMNGFGILSFLPIRIDWTNGCVALANNEIDEIYSQVEIGATIQIKP